MLEYAPCQRLSLADIIGHPWMNGPIATEDEIRQEFRNRMQALNLQANENVA